MIISHNQKTWRFQCKMKNEKPKSFKEEVGSRIKAVLKLRGLTQKKVVEKIYYSKSAFSEALSGNKSFSVETLVKLSKTLKCSTDYFLGLSDFPSKNPLVPDIADYTGLSANAIERLHSFKDADCYKRYYRIPLSDPRFPDYNHEKLKEEYGDDKLFLSLMEPKSIVWLSNFIAHNTAALKIENEFICYLLEYVRKISFDSAQKELQAKLNENNSDSEETNQLYDQVVLHQENSAGHLDTIKESIFNDFANFCNWHFAKLEKEAEEIYLEKIEKYEEMNSSDS